MSDPRYSNRPDHPDFEILSGVVLSNDDAADGDDFRKLTDLYVDWDVLKYTSEQRALRLRPFNRNEQRLIAAGFADGFMAGCGFVVTKYRIVVPGTPVAPDGERREL